MRGLQGDDLAGAEAIAGTAKHLGAYGAVSAGRDYDSVDVSERLLAEVYLPPFQAAVKAGVADDHAVVQRPRRRADDGARRILNDLLRGQLGLRRRDDQRLRWRSPN